MKPETVFNALRANIAFHRRTMRLSRLELGKAAGVNSDTITDLENGISSDMRLSTFVKLATALGVKPQDLFSSAVVVSPTIVPIAEPAPRAPAQPTIRNQRRPLTPVPASAPAYVEPEQSPLSRALIAFTYDQKISVLDIADGINVPRMDLIQWQTRVKEIDDVRLKMIERWLRENKGLELE